MGCNTHIHGNNTHIHGNNARNLSACYLYIKLAKMLCLSYYLFNKIGQEEGGTGSARQLGGGNEGSWPKCCIHM
jgi:hypothetical protein